MTMYSLIKQAQAATTNQNILIENITVFAQQNNITSQQLYESITQVLAGLAQNPNMMNPKSIAALMAGVEKLSSGLASSSDDAKKQVTLKTLAGAAMRRDPMQQGALPNEAVVKIAQFGAKFQDLVQKYEQQIQNPTELSRSLKQLQMTIDRAVQQGQQSTKVSDNPASMGSAGKSAQDHPTPVNRSASPSSGAPNGSAGGGGMSGMPGAQG